jgi:hypothetical protein
MSLTRLYRNLLLWITSGILAILEIMGKCVTCGKTPKVPGAAGISSYKILVYEVIAHKTQFLPDTSREAAARLRTTNPRRARVIPVAYDS